MALPEPPPDPHGTLAWINAVFETIKQAYAALLIPSAAGIAWLIKTSGDRKDKAMARADARRQSEEDAHQRIADQLDRDSAERFDAMKAELTGLKAENADLRAGRLRWFDAAHRMRHVGNRLLGGRGEMPDLPYDPEEEP